MLADNSTLDYKQLYLTVKKNVRQFICDVEREITAIIDQHSQEKLELERIIGILQEQLRRQPDSFRAKTFSQLADSTYQKKSRQASRKEDKDDLTDRQRSEIGRQFHNIIFDEYIDNAHSKRTKNGTLIDLVDKSSNKINLGLTLTNNLANKKDPLIHQAESRKGLQSKSKQINNPYSDRMFPPVETKSTKQNKFKIEQVQRLLRNLRQHISNPALKHNETSVQVPLSIKPYQMFHR